MEQHHPIMSKLRYLGCQTYRQTDRGKALHEYNLIIATHGGTTANRLLVISRGVYKYFFTSNALAKQKRAIRCMMLKPRGLNLRQFAARIQYLINLLPQFQGLENSNNIP